MNQVHKLSFFLPDLRGGGAERVSLLLVQEFLSRGHEVDLLLLRKQGDLLGQMPEKANVIDFKAERVRHGMIPLVRYLRESRPDIFVASMWPLTTIAVIAAKVSRFKGRLIAVEHSALSKSPQNTGLAGFALRASMRWINAHANAVVGVSAGVVDDLHNLGLPAHLGRVIYNPISLNDKKIVPIAWSHHPWMRYKASQRLLAVGALKPAKDYPTLLCSLKMIIDSGRDVSLLVLGTGPLQKKLEEQCRALRLEEHVHFGGFVSDPAPFYRAAGLFVLSSAWEGFANVIVEAMAAGTPVVSTDCRSGPAEILENGRYGRLVPVGAPEALAAAIKESLAASHDTDSLQARAADFSVEKIGEQYLKLLTS